MSTNPYALGLDKNRANHVPLSPLSFLRRTAAVYPQRLAVVHGEHRATWAETYRRCRRLASALARHGVGRQDTVAVMAPNVPAMMEAHFAVPMLGAVLNALNTRLDPAAIAFMLEHGEAKVLITDRELSDIVGRALQMVGRRPLVIAIDDPLAGGSGELLGEADYEDFLASGDPDFEWRLPDDEWDAIALNYTSGTTGNPKGVVFHHRGAYLNAVNNVVTWAMPHFPVYLWTLPMFHCNGWCFLTLALVAGTNVCLRRVEAAAVFDLIRRHGVTHFCGAPVVHNMPINAPQRCARVSSIACTA